MDPSVQMDAPGSPAAGAPRLGVVGCLLPDKKVHRVVTPALVAHAAKHGLGVVALDMAAIARGEGLPAGITAVLHKVGDPELRQRLKQLQEDTPGLLVIDDVEATMKLKDRQTMLEPLPASGLVLQAPTDAQHSNTGPATVHIHRPLQTILQDAHLTSTSSTSTSSGCQELADQLAAAGLQLPLLAKTLRTDSDGDSHVLGVVHTQEGLAALQRGDVPELPLPLVLQQFVPHGERLYKMYVIGPHVILCVRKTLTQQQLEPATPGGVQMFGRISATAPPETSAVQSPVQPPAAGMSASEAPVAAPGNASAAQAAAVQRDVAQQLPQAEGPAASHLESEQPAPQQQPGAPQIQTAASSQASVAARAQQPDKTAADPSTSSAASAGSATAQGDAADDSFAPPLWALQQLAQHLRQHLGLNLFNVDLLRPEEQGRQQQGGQQGQQQQQAQEHGQQHAQQQSQQLEHGDCQDQQHEDAGAAAGKAGTFLVLVDINYFPGFDKVPGAEALLAEYLASVCAAGHL